MGCVPLGGTPDADSTRSSQGRVTGFSGQSSTVQGNWRLSSTAARQGSRWCKPWTQEASGGSFKSSASNAGQSRDNRASISCDGNRQNGHGGDGREELRRPSAVSCPHARADQSGHWDFPKAMAERHCGTLYGGDKAAKCTCGLRQYTEHCPALRPIQGQWLRLPYCGRSTSCRRRYISKSFGLFQAIFHAWLNGHTGANRWQ